MRQRPKATIGELSDTIRCLPRHTRIAMLRGIEDNEIIVGAYSDRDGGVCPMLAAHRAGGRTDMIAFARAWDRFAFREGGRPRSRRASQRELRVLRAHLEASLLEEEAPEADLGSAIEQHRELVERQARSSLLELSRRLAELEAGRGWRWRRARSGAPAPRAHV